jgi:hypothetical protein
MKTMHTTSLSLFLGLLLALPGISLAATNSCTDPDVSCTATVGVTATIASQVAISDLSDVILGRTEWSDGKAAFPVTPLSIPFCVYSNAPNSAYTIQFNSANGLTIGNDFGFELHRTPELLGSSIFKYRFKFDTIPSSGGSVPAHVTQGQDIAPSVGGSSAQGCNGTPNAQVQIQFMALTPGSGFATGFYTDTLSITVTPKLD